MMVSRFECTSDQELLNECKWWQDKGVPNGNLIGVMLYRLFDWMIAEKKVWNDIEYLSHDYEKPDWAIDAGMD